MKIIVSQYGARRRYLIPRILYNLGLLDKLYTDSNNQSPLGRFACLLSKIGIKNKQLQRLTKREPQIPSKLIFSNDKLQIQLFIKRLFRRPMAEIMDIIFEGSAKSFISHGISNPDWLYTMFIENIDFTKFVKSKGVKIMVDVYENPYIFKELAAELNLEEYEPIRHLKYDHIVQAELREKYVDEILRLADKILVPSIFVKNSLKNSPEYDETKINVIPYVSSVTNTSIKNSPILGRIIWIGNDPVRKGLVYVSRALNLLKKKYPFIELRVIGAVPKAMKESPYFKDVIFTGHLLKEQLNDEFSKADMFVFPTLSEGFAGVLLEAASFGVPIITTEGSGIDDQFPGIIVPFKDASAVAIAIERLLLNRKERDIISEKLSEYSRLQTPDAFGEKLLKLFQ